jgi:23S rRNA (adenine2030-N6)-methyltransferase
MNYRHAYHAGNHGDVLKHACLATVLSRLNEKEKPYRVLDTHAGIGLYDLRGLEAVKTGEWLGGIAKLDAAFAPEVETVLAPFRAMLQQTRATFGAHIYPGSPQVALHFMRAQDRLIANELHPDDEATLNANLGSDPRLKITLRDALAAIKAEMPFDPRRGLVLIDPPYENPRETELTMKALRESYDRFKTGIIMVWYPVKGRNFENNFRKAAKETGIPNMLSLELHVQESFEGGGLAGSGLIVVNPPFQFEEQMQILLPALAGRLGKGQWGKATIDWLTPKKD